MKLCHAIVIFGLWPAPGLAQTSAMQPPVGLPSAEAPIAAAVPVVQPDTRPHIVMVTSAGTIELALELTRAPKTSANFLRYVDQKRFDGTSFYRAYAIPNAPGIGLIQGGVRSDPKRVLPPVAHEATTQTGLTHDDGAISMARLAPGSAAGDFFITLGALTSLDADPTKSGDNQGFAVFGHIVKGMDVAKSVLAAPTSTTAGVGAMKGQMLLAPVRIISVRRKRP